MSRRIAAFIRHADYHQLADTPSALQPFGLTGKGIKQAEQAAKSITQFIAQHAWCCVAEVDSSPLLRAWQTAKVFTNGGLMVDNKSSTVTCFDALVERSVGSVANLSTTQIEQIIEQDPRFETLPDHWKSNSYFKLPFVGAESLLDAGKRVAEHLTSRMAALPVTEQVQVKLFVGHGASFRHAAHELGILTFDNIAAFSMYHAQPIYLEYFEDGHWRHIAGDWKIRARHSDYTD